MTQKRLSQQLRDFLKRHEDFITSRTLSSIRETIDVVEFYEEKELRDADAILYKLRKDGDL